MLLLLPPPPPPSITSSIDTCNFVPDHISRNLVSEFVSRLYGLHSTLSTVVGRCHYYGESNDYT